MPRKALTITIPGLGLTVPVPWWSVQAFGVLAIIGVGGVVYRQLRPPADLVTLREANHAMSITVAEYGKHLAEVPEMDHVLFDDPRGQMTVKMFPDGCLLITRRPRSGEAKTKLVPDLARTDLGHREGDEIQPASVVPALAEPVVLAEGRCLDPHPGPFAQTFRKQSECVVEVWRTFTDQCVHFQRMNPCSGVWEANADGSPKVTWVRCVH
jgi:hypothetical protein